MNDVEGSGRGLIWRCIMPFS